MDDGKQLDFNFDVPRKPRGTSRADPTRNLRRHPQTRVKLTALAGYAPIWMGIAANRASEAHIIDLMAGAGRYLDGGKEVAGSSVIMCEAALATVEAQASRGRTWTPHLRFVERNATARASLRTELARFDGLLDYRVLDRPAEEVVGTLARESRGFPTFTFIDPDGIVPISFDLIRSFAGRPFTELLLSIDTMAIHRNVAAGQGVAVEALSGGTWWTEYVHANGDFDLNAYLRRLCRELATVFPVVSIEKLTFPSEHAYRAMVQCCMSQVGRKRWQPIVRKALPPGTQVLQFAAEMELDTIIERLGVLAGRTGLYYKGIMAELPDLPADDGPIHQALLYLREVGLVEWTPWLSRHAYPPPRFSFAQSWPIDLKWDRLQREPDRAPEAVVAT